MGDLPVNFYLMYELGSVGDDCQIETSEAYQRDYCD